MNYYKRHDVALKKLYSNLDSMINDGMFINKKVYMFGTSKIASIIIGFLQNKGINLSGIIDNDKSRQGYEMANLMVKSPESIENDKENTLVLIASSYQNEMIQQLENMGYEYDKNIFKVIDLPKLMSDYSFVERKNYKRMSDSEIKNSQLNIMKMLKKVCDENDIDYYLAYGTLIGAVRHKGFIPWDDDVDIYVRGRDIDKLAELINKTDKYEMITCKNCKEYLDQISLVVDKDTVVDLNSFPLQTTTGVSIDVFPLYGLPSEEDKFREYVEKIREMEIQKWNYLYDTDKCHEIALEMNDYISSFELEKYENTGFVLSPYFTKDYLKTSDFKTKTRLKFEEEVFDVPNGYDNILKTIYGDYMKLPPVEKRGGRHYYNAYYSN